MLIDLTNRTLANRQAAERYALEVIEDMLRTEDRTALLLFGESVATVSWLDGFFTSLLKTDRLEARLAVITSFDDTREHVDVALKRRGLATLCANDTPSLNAGDFEAIGAVSEASREAFLIVRDGGEVSVADVAEAARLTVEAAQQRLNTLLELRLVDRTRVGKAFVYALPRIESRELV